MNYIRKLNQPRIFCECDGAVESTTTRHSGAAHVNGERETALPAALRRSLLLRMFSVQKRNRPGAGCANFVAQHRRNHDPNNRTVTVQWDIQSGFFEQLVFGGRAFAHTNRESGAKRAAFKVRNFDRFNNILITVDCRVLLATNLGAQPVSLLHQCAVYLQHTSKLQSKIGMLMLLAMWMAHCPPAVNVFLNVPGAMAFLTAQTSASEYDNNEELLQVTIIILSFFPFHFRYIYLLKKSMCLQRKKSFKVIIYILYIINAVGIIKKFIILFP